MKTQIDLPKELNKKIKLYSIKNDFGDIKKAIVDILQKFFKEQDE